MNFEVFIIKIKYFKWYNNTLLDNYLKDFYTNNILKLKANSIDNNQYLIGSSGLTLILLIK